PYSWSDADDELTVSDGRRCANVTGSGAAVSRRGSSGAGGRAVVARSVAGHSPLDAARGIIENFLQMPGRSSPADAHGIGDRLRRGARVQRKSHRVTSKWQPRFSTFRHED